MGQPARLRRKQVLISVDKERWLAGRARQERRSESAVLRALIDQHRQRQDRDTADPLDAMVGAFKGRDLRTHDEILYGRSTEAKPRRASS